MAKTVTRTIDNMEFIATQSKQASFIYEITTKIDGEIEDVSDWVESQQTIEDYLDFIVDWNARSQS